MYTYTTHTCHVCTNIVAPLKDFNRQLLCSASKEYSCCLKISALVNWRHSPICCDIFVVESPSVKHRERLGKNERKPKKEKEERHTRDGVEKKKRTKKKETGKKEDGPKTIKLEQESKDA